MAQQTTNSLRTVFGADLAGSIPLGSERTLGLDLRLGWLHEYADTGRPITAAFAGAPSNVFTVYGATPQRDAAVIGFSASTTIADGHAALPALRRRARLGHRQPHAQCRPAHVLVALRTTSPSQPMGGSSQRSSASIRAARTAPSASTGLKAAGRASSAIMASAIASGVADANSMRRPAA